MKINPGKLSQRVLPKQINAAFLKAVISEVAFSGRILTLMFTMKLTELCTYFSTQ
jgi:hypothetical protein